MIKSKIEKIISNYWIKENPYCGLSLNMIEERLGTGFSKGKAINYLKILEKEGKISTREFDKDLWVYPKEGLLKKFDHTSVSKVGKYTKQLLRGGCQVESRFFDREVLHRYKDPHYTLKEDGFSGYLSIKDKWFLDPNFSEDDKISIQSFGTGYTKDKKKIIVVILKDLGDLPVKHQNYWSTYEVEGKCSIDSDFFKQNFEGEWIDRMSPFTGIIEEIKEINKLSQLINGVDFFLKTWDEPPVGFTWVERLTTKEFKDLATFLNNIIIDNINKNFFNSFSKVNFINKENGQKLGTIALLEDFLDKYFKVKDRKPIEEMIKNFKEIRKIRTGPAHAVQEDEVGLEINKKQTDLVYGAYGGLNILRQIFMKHPSAKSYNSPDFLDKARIA